MKIAPEMQDLAEAAFALEPLKDAEAFTVYPLPPGWMDKFVLLLWKPGFDEPSGRKMIDIEIPVMVGGRRGYLMGPQTALNYVQPDDSTA